MRKEGKKAVRDVEAMGVAGGWFVLGIAWIVEQELERDQLATSSTCQDGEHSASSPRSEAELLAGQSRGKGKAGKASNYPLNEHRDHFTPFPSGPSSVEMSIDGSSASTHGKTEESTIIKTPGIHEESVQLGLSGNTTN